MMTTTGNLSPFKTHTGLMGATEPNQPVTIDNAHFLPPGSAVRLADDAILIHLHDDLWYWRHGCAWCYDKAGSVSFSITGNTLSPSIKEK